MKEEKIDQPKDWLYGFTNSSLHLILFMTEQCNFRCLYCYEDFKLGKIQPKVVEGIKKLILNRSKEIKHLAISYFGGEPLMNKSGVMDMSSWAKQVCESKGIKYQGNITTNGYTLDKKTFEALIEIGVTEYQITIDGDKASHDNLRPTINGKKTFTKIINNIRYMASTIHKFECVIRFNVSDSNFEGVKNFISNEAGELFMKDTRFKIHFHPIWGIPELMLTQKNRLENLNEIVNKIGLSHTAESGLTMLNNKEEKKAIFNASTNKGRDADYVCYASRANSFSIRANGQIQKCTVALKDEINNVGKLHSDGTMELDQTKLAKWIFTEDKGCPLQSLALDKLVIPYKDAGKFEKTIA